MPLFISHIAFLCRYYKAKIGEVMAERYEVTEDFVGKGVFSNVCKAKDQAGLLRGSLGSRVAGGRRDGGDQSHALQ